MFNEEQEIIRIEKIKKLQEQGLNPYPYKFELTHTISDIREKFFQLITDKIKVQTAGRIMAVRGHGKACFMDLTDGKEKIQLYFKANIVGDKYELLKFLDIGDFIGVNGEVFETHTKELSIIVNEFSLLSKALHPLPEKWHGLQDKELRYRKRYLDLIMNPDVAKVFYIRTKIIKIIREFLNFRGFIEVETPVLQPVYGGGFAEPFKTKYRALDEDFYLRISDELYLKRLIIGGLDKVYEFGKDFRNEGIDRLHNPEFTQLELYQAYADYNDMMKIVEDLFIELCDKNTIEYQGSVIKFPSEWKKITFFDALKEYSGMDLRAMSDKELKEFAIKKEVAVTKSYHRGKTLESIFDSIVQPNLIEPTFIYDYPKSISPLAKEKRGDSELVERFEAFVAGIEIGNAFSELNDPLEQVKRFEEQESARGKGDFEAQVMDTDFIEALSYGMPPTGGLGLGIDRIVMLFTNSHSIKEVLLFPQLRREE